jgi:hypothetical protein
MTINYKGKLLPIVTKPGTENKGKVAINSNKITFKNTKILAATANLSLASGVTVKNVIKAVDVAKDSARIIDKPKIAATISPRLTPALTPRTTLPEQLDIIKEAEKIIKNPGITFFTSSTQTRPLIPLLPPSSFVPFFTSSLNTGSIKPASLPIPIDGIFTSSSLNLSEQSIFGLASYLTVPINPEMSEKSTGLELRKWEKPRVVAVVAENVLNGYPGSNAVVFKKLTSNRAQVSKYTLYRKSVFKDREFQRIAQLSSEQLTVPEKYVDIVSSLGYNVKDTFVFVDNYIPINSTYVYKIEVEWISTGEEPKQDFNFTPYLGFRPGTQFLSNLFMSGTT